MENKLRIPFPEEHLHQNDGDLERYLKNLASEGLIRHEDFPNSLTAKGVETYANWFSDLTKDDPLHHERGEMIHLEKSTGKLIFPPNPDTGLDSCGFTLLQPRSDYVAALNVHSHPSSACFSGEFGDLGTFMQGWGKGEEYVNFPGMLVSTQRHNFLLLKSDETPTIDRFEIRDNIYNVFFDDIKTMRKKIMAFFDNEYGSHLSWQQIDDRLHSYFGQNIDDYFVRLQSTFTLSEKYKAGFYFSKKDGQYTRFTHELLDQYIEAELLEAIQQMIAN
jgi:hypothetical protein